MFVRMRTPVAIEMVASSMLFSDVVVRMIMTMGTAATTRHPPIESRTFGSNTLAEIGHAGG